MHADAKVYVLQHSKTGKVFAVDASLKHVLESVEAVSDVVEMGSRLELLKQLRDGKSVFIKADGQRYKFTATQLGVLHNLG